MEEKREQKKKESKPKQNAIHSFFFDPNNSPRPERWLPFLLGAFGAYALLSRQEPMEEVSFQTFLNDYMLTKRVQKIDIVKDENSKSEMINHRAEATLDDGKKVYVVLYFWL